MTNHSDTTTTTFKSAEAAAKAWGLANGYEGRKGGWIYKISNDRPIAHGWASFASRKSHKIRQVETAKGKRWELRPEQAPAAEPKTLDEIINASCVRKHDKTELAAQAKVTPESGPERYVPAIKALTNHMERLEARYNAAAAVDIISDDTKELFDSMLHVSYCLGVLCQIS